MLQVKSEIVDFNVGAKTSKGVKKNLNFFFKGKEVTSQLKYYAWFLE